jgi:nitrilase
MREEQGILYADIDLARIDSARRTLDVVGHYARPDLFTLKVRRSPLASVEDCA